MLLAHNEMDMCPITCLFWINYQERKDSTCGPQATMQKSFREAFTTRTLRRISDILKYVSMYQFRCLCPMLIPVKENSEMHVDELGVCLQVAPLDMFKEVNTGTNLPAQIELYATTGNEYHFLFIAKGSN